MADLPQQSTLIQYTADGSTTVYIYPFLILEDEDIAVYVTPVGQQANPTADRLTVNEDYTVQNAGTLSGGTITLTIAAANGAIVTLSRNMQVELDTEFADARNISGVNLDTAFERIVLIAQQLKTLYETRALSYIINTYLPNENNTNFLPPLTGTNKIWISSNGSIVAADLVEGEDVSVLRSQLASETQGAPGSALVGYYDNIALQPTTVSTYLRSFSLKTIQAADTSAVANSIIITTDNSYVNAARNRLILTVAHSVTGASTLTINSLTPVSIVKYDYTGALVATANGDMSGGGVYEFIYTGTQWLLLNPNPLLQFRRPFGGAAMYAGGDQTIANGATTLITFDTVDYDSSTIAQIPTSSFRPTVVGYYSIKSRFQVLPLSGGINQNNILLYKNGIAYITLNTWSTGSKVMESAEHTMLFNGSTDYVQFYFVNTSSAGQTIIGSKNFNIVSITYEGT